MHDAWFICRLAALGLLASCAARGSEHVGDAHALFHRGGKHAAAAANSLSVEKGGGLQSSHPFQATLKDWRRILLPIIDRNCRARKEACAGLVDVYQFGVYTGRSRRERARRGVRCTSVCSPLASSA